MNILVTGISKGLGLEIAKLLLDSGHHVYGVSRTRSEDIINLENIYEDRFYFIQFDLANTSSLQLEIFKKRLPNTIPLHAFINNAAVAYDDIISNVNFDRLESMFHVNTFSPIMMCKFVIRNMIVNQIKGSIVHLSSISVHTGYKGLAMYAASKGALEAFSKNTSREWGELGIRSNCIVAGFMETSMSAGLTESQKDRIYNRTSLKKPTSITSVAETILFLISDKASSITGQNIFIDNGTI